ncbi:hypothetical protein [Burkholderia vietnamiensis]|nr:hypothetical protein [Burkholderia vietnamiensis]
MDDFGNLIGAAIPGVPRRNMVAFHRFHLVGMADGAADEVLRYYGLIA